MQSGLVLATTLLLVLILCVFFYSYVNTGQTPLKREMSYLTLLALEGFVHYGREGVAEQSGSQT